MSKQTNEDRDLHHDPVSGLKVEAFFRTDGTPDANLCGDEALAPVFEEWMEPGKLVVAVTDRDGTVAYVARAPQTDPPELALYACIKAPPLGPKVAAVAWSTEPADDDEMDPAERLERAHIAAALGGVHLVDWFHGDRQGARSLKHTVLPAATWWDVPDPLRQK